MYLVSRPWIKPAHSEGLSLFHHLGKSLSVSEVGNLWQTPENPQFQVLDGMAVWWPGLPFETWNGNGRTMTLELHRCHVH